MYRHISSTHRTLTWTTRPLSITLSDETLPLIRAGRSLGAIALASCRRWTSVHNVRTRTEMSSPECTSFVGNLSKSNFANGRRTVLDLRNRKETRDFALLHLIDSTKVRLILLV